MKAFIHPSRLQGTVHAPASKSSMQRACAAALISRKECWLFDPGRSKDGLAALDIIRNLGAEVKNEGDRIRITSRGTHELPARIDCGESGLAMRMFTPIAALSGGKIEIHGSGSLRERPMDFFDEVLPRLGVEVHSRKGFLPVTVRGPLVPADIEIDGSLSSQFLTGLIMAYVAAGAQDVTIRVKNLQSKPYIDLTLSVLQSFGLPVPENRHYESFYFKTGKTEEIPGPVEYRVEADWSGGAFLLVAGAVAGDLRVTGLDLLSKQADRAIFDILQKANASIAFEAKGIRVMSSEMQAFETDATDCPDLFPPLVALACTCRGRSVISGVHRLVHKESNRALALQQEFGKMNVPVDLQDDRMIITGVETIRGAHVHSHGDHRIAMALAIATLRAEGETVIDGAEAIDKSYPDFFTDLKKLGAALTLQPSFRLHE
jgi:3-phosphoshikimate 1-carboxyvinyltransferase